MSWDAWEQWAGMAGGQGLTPTCWLRLLQGCGKLSEEGRSQSLIYLHLDLDLLSESCFCSHGQTGTSSWEDKQLSRGTGDAPANWAAAAFWNFLHTRELPAAVPSKDPAPRIALCKVQTK